MRTTKTKKKGPDVIILSVTLLLLIFGLTMISSAGVVVAKHRFDDEYYFLKRQLINGVIPGLMLLFVVQKIHYSLWKKVAIPFFVGGIVLLILIFVPGFGIKAQGASRWINLGPISFQPAEMMKLALVIYLASWLEKKKDLMSDWKETFFPFVLMIGAIAFLVIKQPDVGTFGAISLIAMSMFFVAGADLKFILALIVGGVSLLAILVKMAPYRMDRITAFLRPEDDPLGIGYQIKQALIAVGSGGWLGLGLGQSRQKFNFLPEPVGDSIFAVICEELGLIGGSLLVILFLLLALRGFKIAKNAPDRFSCLLVFGIISWIIFQAMINMMAITKIIPLTGIPLPLVSYGSTSLVFVLIGIGIVLNVSRYSFSRGK